MGGSIRVSAGIVAAAMAFQAGPASAQYMPHLDPNLYMLAMMNNGTTSCGPMSESEIDEARLPAPGIMQSYFDAAQAGEPISPLFKLNRRTSWSHGEQTAGEDELDAQSDPLAVAGNSLDPQTLRFFRAGMHQTAQGQWLVTTPQDQVAGVYTAQFERKRGEWKLLSLAVSAADELVAPIMQYCTEPADLNEAKVTGAQSMVSQAERRVERWQGRFERYDARALEAEARAAEKPDSSSRARQASERRARADERLEQWQEAQQELAEQQDKLTSARAEFAELEALTTLARNARDFRLLDDDGTLLSEQDE